MSDRDQTGASLRALRRRVGTVRRAAAEKSFRAFCEAYLAHHFKAEPSAMHLELFALLEEAAVTRGARLAIAAPRGHAKSTIVGCAYVLWRLCPRAQGADASPGAPGAFEEPYILLISNTQDQASDFLSFIKSELTGNLRLRDDFPELAEPGDTPSSRWRRDEIITRTGVKITALGADTKIRGRRNREHRPSLIILDDVENETEVRSAEQRERKLEWFNRAVLKAGSPSTNVIVVGTVLHYDSLLARLLDPARGPGWTARKYQAVRAWSQRTDLWSRWEAIYCKLDEEEGASGPAAARAFFEANREAMLEGTEALWPAREPYERLMELRLTEGRASFDAEKQNEPVNPEDCCFLESDFVFWDRPPYGSPLLPGCGAPGGGFAGEDELLAFLGEHLEMYGACDPSMGKAGRNRDDSAIITIAVDSRSGVMYVLDADIRRRKPDAIIEDAIAHHRRRGYCRFGFESNQFQAFLAEELQRRSRAARLEVPVFHVHQSADKLGRVQRLQPLIASGTLRFSRRHTHLLEQLRQFPAAAHDDGPDALEMAVASAEASKAELIVIGGSRDRRRLDDDWGWVDIRDWNMVRTTYNC